VRKYDFARFSTSRQIESGVTCIHSFVIRCHPMAAGFGSNCFTVVPFLPFFFFFLLSFEFISIPSVRCGEGTEPEANKQFNKWATAYPVTPEIKKIKHFYFY